MFLSVIIMKMMKKYKERFEYLFSNIYNILETKAVDDGDIAPNLKTETIRQKIRDEFIKDKLL